MFKQEPKDIVKTNEDIVDTSVKIDEYPKKVSETPYSVKYEEEEAFFEYITFNVAGVTYYQKEIKKAIAQEKDRCNFEEKYSGMTNAEILECTYDEPVFLHQDEFFSECHLQLEEDNEHDPQAVTVYINELKVGHVPLKNYKEGKEFIFNYLKEGACHPVSARLYGGKYKINRDDMKVDTGESTYKIECQIVMKTEK
ncbi:hypothetical protein KM892_05745 [Bacillus pumilus]|nr:hypothetical protein [Bacillus pumilus]